MENIKNIAPLSDFDWNAFENGVAESAQSQEELEKDRDKFDIFIFDSFIPDEKQKY